MTIRKDEFEDSEEMKDEMKDEKIEGTRDEGNHDEDENKEVMLTSPDSRYGEVDVVRERGSMMQVQVEQLLKSVGYKSNAAEHHLHRGAP